MKSIKPAQIFNPYYGFRRKSLDGKQLHSCVVCEKLEPWSDDWKYWGSVKDVDDGVAVAKFCSDKCRKHRMAVTPDMCEDARKREWTGL